VDFFLVSIIEMSFLPRTEKEIFLLYCLAIGLVSTSTSPAGHSVSLKLDYSLS